MFCNIDLVKNHKAANNSTTTKARGESADLENILMQLRLNLKTIKFYFKNSHRFLLIAKLFTG
jgi:hypothetical protein